MYLEEVLDFIDENKGCALDDEDAIILEEYVPKTIQTVKELFKLIPDYKNLTIECDTVHADLVIGFKNKETFETVILYFYEGSISSLEYCVSHDFHSLTLAHDYHPSIEDILKYIDKLAYGKLYNIRVLYTDKLISVKSEGKLNFNFPPNVIISLQSLSQEETTEFKKELYDLLVKYGLK